MHFNPRDKKQNNYSIISDGGEEEDLYFRYDITKLSKEYGNIS